MRTETGTTRERVVASFGSHAEAVRAVGQLARTSVPVERVSIVGRELAYIEDFTTRPTPRPSGLKMILAGAGVGLFFGTIFGLFEIMGPIASAPLVGLYGMLFGGTTGAILALMGLVLTSMPGQLESFPRTAAGRYDLVVDEGVADRASAVFDQVANPGTDQ